MRRGRIGADRVEGGKWKRRRRRGRSGANGWEDRKMCRLLEKEEEGMRTMMVKKDKEKRKVY